MELKLQISEKRCIFKNWHQHIDYPNEKNGIRCLRHQSQISQDSFFKGKKEIHTEEYSEGYLYKFQMKEFF